MEGLPCVQSSSPSFWHPRFTCYMPIAVVHAHAFTVKPGTTRPSSYHYVLICRHDEETWQIKGIGGHRLGFGACQGEANRYRMLRLRCCCIFRVTLLNSIFTCVYLFSVHIFSLWNSWSNVYRRFFQNIYLLLNRLVDVQVHSVAVHAGKQLQNHSRDPTGRGLWFSCRDPTERNKFLKIKHL